MVPITSSCARRISDPRVRRLDHYHYASHLLEQVARYDRDMDMYYVYYYHYCYDYYGYNYYITTSVMDKTSVVIEKTDVNEKTDV